MKFLIIALTSLFVSFMPLQAAYAQGIDGTVSAGCVTVEQVVTPENLAILAERGGSNFVLKSDGVKLLTDKITEVTGKEPPVQFDEALVFIPSADSEFANIAWMKDGCMVNSGHFPIPLLNEILKRS